MKNDSIDAQIEFNSIKKESKQAAKGKTCLICGREQTSFCNSHSVPQFVLHNISENGKLLPSQITLGYSRNVKNTGIKSAGTFQSICRECDQAVFADYEKPESLQTRPTNKILNLIALKNTLLCLHTASIAREFYRIDQERNHVFLNPEGVFEEKSLDVRDDTHDLERYISILQGKHHKGFSIIYWEKLPYITPIAVQIGITLHRSISGRVINNVYDYNPNVIMQAIHLCVFPLKSETAVLLFYHKDDRRIDAFSEEFKRLSSEQKLQYINYLIFKNTENFYCAPALRPFVKCNHSLEALSKEVYDRPDFGIQKAPDIFKKYQPVSFRDIPNFLSEQYSLANLLNHANECSDSH